MTSLAGLLRCEVEEDGDMTLVFRNGGPVRLTQDTAVALHEALRFVLYVRVRSR